MSSAMNPGLIILVLKVAVVAVTVLLLLSLLALAVGKQKLHGQINIVFFALTLAAVLGLELVARLLDPDSFRTYLTDHHAVDALTVHLCFSVPAALLLPLMLFTGLRHRRNLHIG